MKNLFIVFLLISSLAYSQPEFKAEFDITTFSLDDSVGIAEIYYAYFQPGMKIFYTGEQAYVSGKLQISFYDAVKNELVYSKEWKFDSPIDTLNPNSQNLTGVLQFQFPLGNYVCKLKGRDAQNPLEIDSVSFQLSLKGLNKDRFSISGLQIASKIKQFSSEKKSIFYKNTLEVVPNPSLVFGENLPVLYFYCELYNLNLNVRSEKLKVEHILYNFLNEQVYNKSKYITRKNSSIVEIGAININKFPTGEYTLMLAVSDTLLNFSITSAKKIFIINPKIVPRIQTGISEIDILASELAVMSLEELDLFFIKSRYIASHDEIQKWNKLTELEAKKIFLHDFWKRRDKNSSTPENEAKIEYFQRLEYANKNFGNLFVKEGWRTEKGRVFMVFGPPSEIERHPSELNTHPFEIWQYDEIEGGVIFVFADLSGYSDYRLVHSTKRGELIDENWYQTISQN